MTGPFNFKPSNSGYVIVKAVFPNQVYISYNEKLSPLVHADLAQINNYEGFAISKTKTDSAESWIVTFPEGYELYEVGAEIGRVLKTHNLKVRLEIRTPLGGGIKWL